VPDRPLTIGIQRPLVVKVNELCLVADQSGSVRADLPGMGLFYRDCRYLGRYELRLDEAEPLQLAANAALGFAATIVQSTCPAFEVTTASGVPPASSPRP
jgi:hypothetical protein